MSSAVAEFSEMEEVVTFHVMSLRTDLREELVAFSLRSDQTPHRHIVKMGSLLLTEPRQRLQYLEAAFKFLRQIVDEAVHAASVPRSG